MTATILSKLYDDIKQSIKCSEQNEAVFINYSKAFDSLDFYTLIKVKFLSSLGIKVPYHKSKKVIIKIPSLKKKSWLGFSRGNLLQVIERGVIRKVVRSSHLDVFCRKVALKNFLKFTWKYLCWSQFLIIDCASGLELHFEKSPMQVLSSEF